MGASLCTPNDTMTTWEPSGGPHVVNQVFTAVTGWGYAARCGCGWKTPHESHAAALAAGRGHLQAEHALEQAAA